jgi:membrane-associated protein
MSGADGMEWAAVLAAVPPSSLADVGTFLLDWTLALVGSPWVFVVLYVMAVLDGVFPPVPSESVVIALAALSVTTGEPALLVVAAVAAAGAFTGDQLAYGIGRRIPVRRMRVMQGPGSQRAIGRAERALAERGAAYIIAARYVPVGRVAVNMTAGTVGYPRRRFTPLAALASVTWAAYTVTLGVTAGVWFSDHPVLAVLVGVAGGVLLGIGIDAALRRLAQWRDRRAARTRRGDTVVLGRVTVASPDPLAEASGVEPGAVQGGVSSGAPAAVVIGADVGAVEPDAAGRREG